MTIDCVLAHGRHDGDIRTCLATLTNLPPPAHSWYEPRPGSALDEQGQTIPGLAAADLHPLLKSGPLAPPAGMTIDEARLFWPWGSLYLIDEGEGSTRWSFWACEDKGPNQPRDPDVQQAITATKAQAAPGLTLDRVEVLLLQDAKRFFGTQDPSDPRQRHLYLLRRDGAVIGWTMTDQQGRTV